MQSSLRNNAALAPPLARPQVHLWTAILAGTREPASLLPAITFAVFVLGARLTGWSPEPFYDSVFMTGVLSPVVQPAFSGWAGSSLLAIAISGTFNILGAVSVIVGILLARKHPWLATGLAVWPFLSIPLLSISPPGAWAGLVVITVLSIPGGRRAWAVPLVATVVIGAVLPAGGAWGYNDPASSITYYASSFLWFTSVLIIAALAVGLFRERRHDSSVKALPSLTVIVQVFAALATLWWFCLPASLTLPSEAWIAIHLNAPIALAPWMGLTLGAAGTASTMTAIVLARRRPGLATVLAAWPVLTLPLFGVFKLGWLVALVVVAAFAGYDGWRRGIPALSLSFLTILAWLAFDGAAQRRSYSLSFLGPDGMMRALTYVLFALGAYAVAVAVGTAVRARQRTTAAAATERRALAIESLATERARLARDLHDVVAHHVSLVAVRAESAPFVHPDLNENARDVLGKIATDARSALDELRQVLAVLQRTEGETGDGPELAPQPDACDIPELVEQGRAAGHDVTLEGVCEGIPAAQGYVLYRAAQEALTNARRHAPGTLTEVALMHDAGVVGLRVTNPTPEDARPSTLTPGRGLIGMRERAEALGGDVSTTVNGVFTLLVTMPLDPSEPR